MPHNVLMPALSPTMTEGKLAKWHKKEGDTVKAGQVIAEIETDKATMEVEAVDEGTLAKILVPAGTEGVKVNTLIAVLLEEGEDASAISKAAAPKAVTPANQPKSEPSAPQSLALIKPSQERQASSNNYGRRVFASPLARRLAQQQGIDLSSVKGSGPNGRIVKSDLQGAPKGGAVAPAAKSASGGAVSMPQGVDAKALADAYGMPYKLVPNSGVRKVIAKRLLESKQTVPHYYLTVDVELDTLMNVRKDLNEQAQGYKLSVNDFIIKAAAVALQKVPGVNASWSDEAVIQYERPDVSVAVASDNGLITPIVKDAAAKSLKDISNEMKDLAGRAREGKLKPAEFQGGTISISNLGMFGIREFSAIINPPQSCILAIGAGEQRPVVKDGVLKIATVMTVTASFDHRTVDGALGAEFLSAFKKLLEAPMGLIL